MAKEPIEYEPIGTVWRPKPKPKQDSGALWGWVVLATIGVLLLSQCS